MSFILAGTALLKPNEFIPKEQRIDAVERASDGTLTSDVKGIKGEYSLKWEILEAADYVFLLNLYRTSIPVSFVYPEEMIDQTKNVWISRCEPTKGVKAGATEELYLDVVVELMEV